MSHAVTFTSGVYTGRRGTGGLNPDWFGGSPVEEFEEFTLTADETQPLTGIQGMPARRKPVVLRFTGSGLSAVEERLHQIEAYPVLNGQPRTTMSGFLDVVAGKGHLAKMTLSLLGDTAPREEWGVIADLQVSVDRGNRGWSIVATFYPCDLIWYTGSDQLAIRPGAAGAPGGGGGVV